MSGTADTGDHDDVSIADVRRLVQFWFARPLLDADGDSDMADLDVSTDVFKIEDDGPDAVLE